MPPPSPPPPSRETIARMTSTQDLLASFTQGPVKFGLPTEFVLPPPSPEASLPMLSPKSTGELMPQFNLAGPSSAQAEISIFGSDPFAQAGLLQRTPGFNKKKSLPQRVMHAYSPVKPSPLSRILMMADDSLPSVDDDDDEPIEKPHLVDFRSLARPPLATLLEEDDTGKLAGVGDSGRVLTLEDELGISMDRDDDAKRGGGPMVIEDIGGSPLKEMNVRRKLSPRKAAAPSRRPTTLTAAAPPKAKPAIPKRPVVAAATNTTNTTKDKGKGKEVESKATARTRTAAAAGLDKENSAAKRLKPSPPDTKKRPVPAVARPGVSGRTRSAPAATTGRVGPGPRRVPVGGGSDGVVKR